MAGLNEVVAWLIEQVSASSTRASQTGSSSHVVSCNTLYNTTKEDTPLECGRKASDVKHFRAGLGDGRTPRGASSTGLKTMRRGAGGRRGAAGRSRQRVSKGRSQRCWTWRSLRRTSCTPDARRCFSAFVQLPFHAARRYRTHMATHVQQLPSP